MTDNEIFIPPDDLNKWDISIINALVELKYPESDTLEFKEQVVGDLEKDICGFANSSGGLIVIGIKGMDKAEEKKGLQAIEEHNISQQLTGRIAQVEPNPKVLTKQIVEGDKLYVVIKIYNVSNLKPLALKNRGSFHIRLNGTTQPASRAIILNLFSNNIGRRERLIILKNAIQIISNELSVRKNRGGFSISKDYIQNISEIDLFFIKSSIVNAGDLIFDLDDFGRATSNSYTIGLLTTVIPKLEEANANIRGFNGSTVGGEERGVFANWVSEFGRGEIVGILDNLSKCKITIEKVLND
ncbi:MAG: AlbA family DNA-binding domain-containing protein [Nitrosotalea sp.]